MSSTPIYQGQTFYSPRFEIRLKGQNLGREVIRDVLQVSYREDLENLDSFEFTLRDWDPVERIAKYSNPFDSNGNLRQIGDFDIPNFEPGATVELRIGYGEEAPSRIMLGTIVSLSPSFPASGAPSLTVRAMNLLYTLQRRPSEPLAPFENRTDSEIARDIADALDIPIEIPEGQIGQEPRHDYVLVNNEYPILFLLQRARRQGYDLYVETGDDDEPRLFFGRRPTSGKVYELTWGKTLLKFTPTITVRNQVNKVVVRGWNPLASGDSRTITGEATREDLDQGGLEPELLSSLDSALAQTHEVVVDEPITSQEQADSQALGILRNLAGSLITGQGSSIGFPPLRAGRRVHINGLGRRYNGDYLITEASHTLGGSGYTTDFSARREGAS
ncbi:phage late control D family protein [Marinobacter lacisalsi]|uniref:Phage late control D family protein n=1 Tax=Marinobacter lacisalsi TaxID=475979 RepID=A0ABV8QMQ3_9GAMM